MYSDGRSSITIQTAYLKHNADDAGKVCFMFLQSSAAFHSEGWTCHVYVADWIPADMTMAFN